MKKVITTMLVAAMVLSMAVPTSAATITRKKSTGTSASTTKVSGDYSLKMVDKTLQFIRGGKVVSSIETKDGKITLRKSSAGGISVVFTDANGKRRNITLGKQDSVSLSGTFTQVSVDKALGSSFEVEMEKGSKVTNFYAKGAAKVTLNGSVTTLNVTSSNANVAANGTVSRAYAVNKKAITGMSSGKITQTSTGTSASGSVNTSTGSSSSSNTTVNSGSGSSGSSSSGSSGIIINGGGSNNGGNTVSKKNPKVTASSTAIPSYDEGTVLNTIPLAQFGLKAMYGNTEIDGIYSWNNPTSKVAKGTYSYRINFTPKDTKTYNSATIDVKIEGKEVIATQTLAEAKKAIEEAMPNWTVNNATTEKEIEELAAAYLKDGITAKAEITKVEATPTADGSIKGTITLTKGTETATVTVNLKIAKVSALDAAKAEVEAALDKLKADQDTDKAAIETALADVIAKYKDVKISVGEVVLDETAKTVSVKVSLTEGDGEPVEVSKTWTYTEQASALEEAKAKVVAALDGITASKDIDKAAIEAALADIKTEYPTVEITVGDVVPNETAKTVSVEVSLKEGEKTDKVAKTWDYSGQAVAKKPTFTKHPEAPATGSDVTLSKDTPVTLEVAANVDGSTEGVTYQWYRSTSSLVDNATARTAIDGATSATYTLAPEDEGSFYFFAEATHTVGNTKESSFSNNVLLKVTVPAGSAVDKPTFKRDLTNGNRGVRLGEQTVLEVEVNTPSTANTTTKYQWYKSTDPANPLNGQPMDRETNSTLTVANDTLGTASYYCVVTNVSTDDVDFNNRTATSKYETITVADTVGIKTVTAVTDPTTGGTTKLNVTFTKEVTGLTAANFKVEGKEETKADGTKVTPKITLGEVESFSNNKSLYTLHVSGIDISGQATVEFIAPDGFTVSGTNPQTVAITAPVEVVTVQDFTAAKKNAQGETTQLKVTFDKAISSAAKADYVVSMPTKADIVTDAKVDPADDHSVLLDVVLSTDPDELEATLTTANGKALAAADQKKVTVERDTKAPTVKTASLTSNNKEIELLMSEPLKAGQTLNKSDFAIDDTATPPVTVTISDAKFKEGSNNTVIVLTADKAIDITTMTLSYTNSGTAIIDTAASENALADFTGVGIDGAILPETLAIQEVEVTSKTEAVVKMNAPIKTEATAPELKKLFKATDKNDSTKEYTIDTVVLDAVATRARATVTASNNAFKITFASPLPAGAVVVISINPDAADVAAKVVIDGKEDAKLPVNQPPVVAPEVKAVSATVADVEVAGKKGTAITATDVVITLADGTFDDVAAEASGNTWITNLPAGLDASLAAITAGDKTATITISGQPSEALEAAMTIEIPASAIVDATAPLTVTANAKAKFAIVDDTPAAALNASFAAESTLVAPITANTKVGAITATGGTGPYTYAIKTGTDTDGNFNVTATGEVQAKKPLAAGTYACTATVTDSKSATKDVSVSITVTPAPAADAPDITDGIVAVGSKVGSTKITVTNSSGNSYKVEVANAEVTRPKVGVAASGNAYTSGNDIDNVDAATNKYVALYEVDASGNVVAFHCYELTADDIKAVTPITDNIDLTKATTLEAVKFTASQAATLPATTALSPVVPGVDTLSIEWKDKNNATISGGTFTPTAGDTITAIVTVTPDADHTFASDYSGTITEPSTATSANGIVSNGNLIITVEYSVN